ncbi:hypothetical protein GCM10023068_10000 [Leifsonia shinshuensis]
MTARDTGRRGLDDSLALLVRGYDFAAGIWSADLEKAPELYELFRDKKDGCVKVVLHP